MSLRNMQKELLESLKGNIHLKVEVLNFTDSTNLQISILFKNKTICADSIDIQSLLKGSKND